MIGQTLNQHSLTRHHIHIRIIPHRIRPDYEDALMGVATLLGDAGQLEEGLEFMQRAVDSGGEIPNVYNNLGAYMLRLGKRELNLQCLLAVVSTLHLDFFHFRNNNSQHTAVTCPSVRSLN